MPTNATNRTPLLRLPGMRRADAASLGRTNQQVRRNVPRLRRLLTPKISRGRQPTEALMIIEEFHPEEMQALATRGLADERSMQSPLGAPLLAGCWQGAGYPKPELLLAKVRATRRVERRKERGAQNLSCYWPRSGPPAHPPVLFRKFSRQYLVQYLDDALLKSLDISDRLAKNAHNCGSVVLEPQSGPERVPPSHFSDPEANSARRTI